MLAMIGKLSTVSSPDFQPAHCSLRRAFPKMEESFNGVYLLQESHIAMEPIARIGVLTVSDRASRGEYEDLGGPAICEYLQQVFATTWSPERRIVSDDRQLIAAELQRMADEKQCCLIITTGGTGPARRDVTPEATEDVCEKMMPGFGELMRKVSLEKVPTAILSRQTAGIRGSSLIVNLPGQPKAIRECLDAVMPAIPYCIDLIGGPRLETNVERIVAFRPKGK